MASEKDIDEIDMPKSPRQLKSYSLELKRRIVEETFAPGASVSVVARRHNVNANMVFTWRSQYREGTLRGSRRTGKASPLFIPVGIVNAGPAMLPLPAGSGSGIAPQGAARQIPLEHGGPACERPVEIELPNRVKLRIDAGIGEASLRCLLLTAMELPC